MKRAGKAGFSLVEVLITLVILGLITGLLFDGVGGAARLTLRLSDAADRLERNALAADWWRVSIISAIPSEPRVTPNFTGQRAQLHMDTVSSLHARVGVLRTVNWRLVQSGSTFSLHYVSDDVDWTVATTRQGQPYFSYCCDREGRWGDTWTDEKPPRLVALVGFFETPVLAHPRSRMIPEQPPERPGIGM